MTIFLKVEHKNNKADINFETSIFKHTLMYIKFLRKQKLNYPD